jgi:hypothetical protein
MRNGSDLPAEVLKTCGTNRRGGCGFPPHRLLQMTTFFPGRGEGGFNGHFRRAARNLGLIIPRFFSLYEVPVRIRPVRPCVAYRDSRASNRASKASSSYNSSLPRLILKDLVVSCAFKNSLS